MHFFKLNTCKGCFLFFLLFFFWGYYDFEKNEMQEKNMSCLMACRTVILNAK